MSHRSHWSHKSHWSSFRPAANLFVFIATLSFLVCEPSSAQTTIRLATTTSTEQSGLLAHLLPSFEGETGIKVEVIAVGSGKALKLGENGDADVILSHAPALEAAFVDAGFGVDRRSVMYNDFVVVGPKSDPAGIAGERDATNVFRKLSAGQATFISRGDESGTHVKEREIWKEAGITPTGKWYLSAGLSMGDVLIMADEKQAYTLADRGTFLSYQKRLDLVILSEGNPPYFNPYTIMAVSPQRHPTAKYSEARRLIEWITSTAGQNRIASFQIAGKQLFFPSAKAVK